MEPRKPLRSLGQELVVFISSPNWASPGSSCGFTKRYYRALTGLAVDGDGKRLEVAEARIYLAQN